MADICMCDDNKCPSRTLCYRFTAKKCPYRQTYFAESSRKKDAIRCGDFWDNSGIPDPSDDSVHEVDCHCGAMALAHKRTEICDIYQKKKDREGIKSQKHILKEFTKLKRKVRKV
jgi:hypothetical protein